MNWFNDNWFTKLVRNVNFKSKKGNLGAQQDQYSSKTIIFCIRGVYATASKNIFFHTYLNYKDKFGYF